MSNPSPSAGSVLVPREPTDEMIVAVVKAMYGDLGYETAFDTDDQAAAQNLDDAAKGHYDYGEHVSQETMRRNATRVIKAMLTAAPAPVLVIELDQPRIADGGQCNEQQSHAPSDPSKLTLAHAYVTQSRKVRSDK